MQSLSSATFFPSFHSHPSSITPLQNTLLLDLTNVVTSYPQVDVRACDMEGKSCLHWAAGSIYPLAPKCLNLIYKKAQDLLYAADVAGKTPLHWCAIGGTVDTLRALLECGLPDVMATDEEQHTAVHWAAGQFALVHLRLYRCTHIHTQL